MKKPELYQMTVDILVAAYFNDTLIHGSCSACAVGNLAAAAKGYEVRDLGYEVEQSIPGLRPLAWIKDGNRVNPIWQNLFVTPYVEKLFGKIPRRGKQIVRDKFLNHERIMGEIEGTGYSWQQLAMIEKAFESTSLWLKPEKRMFAGLMAVVDMLDKIHENTDKAVNTTSRKRFKALSLAFSK